jgi:hypothetical protein
MKINISLDGRATLYYRLMMIEGEDREGRIAIEGIRSAIALSEIEEKSINLEKITTVDGEVTAAGWRRRCTEAIAKSEVTMERDHAKRLLNLLERWNGIRQLDHTYFAEDLYKELKSAL